LRIAPRWKRECEAADLVNHMVAAVDIERIARYQPGGVVGEEGGGEPHIHDADEAARGRFLLGFMEEFVEFRNAGCGARREPGEMA
jgi:hypothetical protein